MVLFVHKGKEWSKTNPWIAAQLHPSLLPVLHWEEANQSSSFALCADQCLCFAILQTNHEWKPKRIVCFIACGLKETNRKCHLPNQHSGSIPTGLAVGAARRGAGTKEQHASVNCMLRVNHPFMTYHRLWLIVMCEPVHWHRLGSRSTAWRNMNRKTTFTGLVYDHRSSPEKGTGNSKKRVG